MKKVLMLLMFLLVVTGCEAIYTIEINNNEFRETLTINNRDRRTWNIGNPSYEEMIRNEARISLPTDIQDDFDPEGPIEGVNNYHIQLIDTSDNLGLRYFNIFNGIEEYRNSTIAVSHFSLFEINRINRVIEITSGTNNFAFEMHEHLTSFTVRLVTNYDVLDHNADEVTNGVYYWRFIRGNNDNREINVRLAELLDNEEPNLWQTDNDGYFGINTLIVVYIILFITLIISLLIIYLKIKNSNR